MIEIIDACVEAQKTRLMELKERGCSVWFIRDTKNESARFFAKDVYQNIVENLPQFLNKKLNEGWILKTTVPGGIASYVLDGEVFEKVLNEVFN